MTRLDKIWKLISTRQKKTQLSKLVQTLIDQSEETINICINGKPVVLMTLINKRSRRVEAAKGKWKHITIEDLNSIDISKDFDK